MSTEPAIYEMLPFNFDLSARPIASIIDQAVGYILLNMPETKNALSAKMMTRLDEKLTEYNESEAVRVIVICARGDVFSAGHDLKELDARRTDTDKGSAYFRAIMRQCADLMLHIGACRKPVLAVIDGLATAAGCQLVASCDLAVATSTSKFATPGVNIGLFCSTPMVALSRNIGRKQAMAMLLLGEAINADTACSYGLVNKIAPPDKLWAEVEAITSRLRKKPALTLSRGLGAFYRQSEMTLEEAYDYTINVMVENMLGKDAKEGTEAFINKTKPDWSKLRK